MIAQLKAGWVWLLSHRTKTLGLIGSALTYAYMNQDKLQLVISAKYYATCMAVISGAVFIVGLCNTLIAWRRGEAPPT